MPIDPTYEPIATTTLSVAAATINFSSISASYTDLRLVLVETGSTAADCNLRFNSLTTTYSGTFLEGTGTATASFSDNSAAQLRWDRLGSSTTVPSIKTADIFSYAGSTYKTVLMTSSADRNGSGDITVAVGVWRNTAAITSVNILRGSGNFSIGTTATLYGILRA